MSSHHTANPTSQSNRRKTLVVNPQLQKRLIVTISLAPALGLSATMSLICFFCHNLYTEATRLDVQLDSLMPLFLSVSGFVLVSGFFMISNALMISHRIAGPSYRLSKSIEQIRGGDVAFRVNLRRGDHLEEIRDELNELLDVLNENPPEGFRTRADKEAEENAARLEAAKAESDAMTTALAGASADRATAAGESDAVKGTTEAPAKPGPPPAVDDVASPLSEKESGAEPSTPGADAEVPETGSV